MNRLGTILTTTLVLTFAASGCGVPKVLGGEGSCHKADPQVVDAIMAKAQTNFDDGPGTTTIARLDPVRTAAVDLPEKERFGDFTMLVAIRSNYVDPSGDVMGMGNGVLMTDVFASDPTGTKLAEFKPVSPAAFDVPDPDDSGWAGWKEHTIETGAWSDAYHCVDD